MIGEKPKGLRSGDRYFWRSRDGVGDALEDDVVGGVRGRDEDPRELGRSAWYTRTVRLVVQRVELERVNLGVGCTYYVGSAGSTARGLRTAAPERRRRASEEINSCSALLFVKTYVL